MQHALRAASSTQLLATGRSAITAVVSFVEEVGAGMMDAARLRAWIEEHLVTAHRMRRPAAVFEPDVGVVVLFSGVTPDPVKLAALLRAARERVVDLARGLVGHPVDDRFVNAAIFGGRVRRDACGEWVACPRPAGALSEIVASLLAADVLQRRDVYEQRLRVCDVCGRIGLDATSPAARGTCFEHPLPA